MIRKRADKTQIQVKTGIAYFFAGIAESGKLSYLAREVGASVRDDAPNISGGWIEYEFAQGWRAGEIFYCGNARSGYRINGRRTEEDD